MKLALYIGNQALSYLRTEEFQEKWKALYAQCPWVTACQHPDFVVPWYELYRDKFFSVVVLAEADDHSLAGLFPLAFDKQQKRLVGAGERQAEYQGWLTKQESGNTFIHKAIHEVRENFPGVELVLKYLPPGIPLDWISSGPGYRRFCQVHRHRRPLMRIDEAAMNRQRNKKNNRQNFNRLKRIGEVQFEKVSDHDQFVRMFDQMCMQYDFRQGALHHQMPFTSDPLKKPFYHELHRRGLLHTTILKVGDGIAASHSGLISNAGAVHLGINTHDPSLATHSPGTLLLAMLGVQLVQENIPLLDLTPGGDGYKEYFASDHDDVFELTIYGSLKARMRNEMALGVKRFLKSRLYKAGVKTADARAAVAKLLRIKDLGLLSWLKVLRNTGSLPCRLYCHSTAVFPAADCSLTLSQDNLKDIFRFDPSGSAVTRWEFLKTTMDRLEESMHLYSFSSGGTLLIYCWVKLFSTSSNAELPVGASAIPDNAPVLFDLYIHRQLDRQDLVKRFLEQVLCELKIRQKHDRIYFKGAINEEVQAVLEHCGFIEDAGERQLQPPLIPSSRYST